MALANILSGDEHPPEPVRTVARVQLRNLDGAPKLTRVDLDPEERVPGIDQQQFESHAQLAKTDCPVSRALAGIPEMERTTRLL